MLKLSIIIPVFNVEEYLKECLDSILAQKNRGIEIILVENYSSDKSYEICKDYKEKFPKVIKVFRTKKWGASAVRNYGVKKASGEYLWFIDSDDWIEKGAIEKVLGKVEKKEADVVCISVRRVYEDGRTNILTAVNPKEKNWKEKFNAKKQLIQLKRKIYYVWISAVSKYLSERFLGEEFRISRGNNS